MCNFVYVFLGSVKNLIVGPTTIMALMIQPFVAIDPNYAHLLSLINGIVIFTCGIFQLGKQRLKDRMIISLFSTEIFYVSIRKFPKNDMRSSTRETFV